MFMFMLFFVLGEGRGLGLRVEGSSCRAEGLRFRVQV